VGEFQNKVLRKVLLSVFQLPTLFFFTRHAFRRLSLYHQRLKCTVVLHFHDRICCITTSAEMCFIMYCTCMSFHGTIYYMRAMYSTKAKSSAVKKHTRAMHDKLPLSRRGTTHKIMELYNHNTLQTPLIV
jgi:hypothetical protein